MKNNKIIFGCLLLLTLLFSCRNKKTPVTKNITQQIHTQIDIEGNTQTFYYFKPANADKFPSYILAIDPHGNGKLACLKFKEIAKQIGAVSVGLNTIENNIPDYQNKIKQAVQEVKNKFNITGKPVLIAGFSGGARMAFGYAIQNNINSVIMCGAGVGNQIPVSKSFRLACISGYKDFNFMEQYYSPYSNLIESRNYISLHFDGIHEWPSEELLLQAGNFVLNNNTGNPLSYNNVINTSEQLLTASKYLDAFKTLEFGYKTCSRELAVDYKIAIGQLINNENFKSYIKGFENILTEEQERNKNYMQSLIQKDFIWWKNEKSEIELKTDDVSNALISNSYYRTKAFLGVLLFSKTNASVRTKKMDEAQKFLKIYYLLEPENPDVFYLQALYDFYKGTNIEIISENLLKAIELGFSDYSKMRNDFSAKIVNKVL